MSNVQSHGQQQQQQSQQQSELYIMWWLNNNNHHKRAAYTCCRSWLPTTTFNIFIWWLTIADWIWGHQSPQQAGKYVHGHWIYMGCWCLPLFNSLLWMVEQNCKIISRIKSIRKAADQRKCIKRYRFNEDIIFGLKGRQIYNYCLFSIGNK